MKKMPRKQTKSRICVLGNSHIAALKGGWEKTTKNEDNRIIDFYGCLSNGMASLDYIDGKIGPREVKAAEFFRKVSGRGEFIDPNEYEVFILCGMGMFPTAIFNNYRDFMTPTSKNLTAKYYVTDECLADTLWEELERSMMFHCARLIRNITAKPIYIAWQAFLSETLFGIEWRKGLVDPILVNEDQEFVHKAMEQVETRLVKEGFKLLRQPDQTISQGIMTHAKFSYGSVLFREELTKRHRENDVFHMNSVYGAECWATWVI